MTDAAMLDRVHTAIMRRIAATGSAPHFTELAAELGCPLEEARQALPDLMAAGVPGWLHPGTDYLASFPPFNVQPTQYRISIDGVHGWFGQ
jgi:hypothetical protein